MHILLGADIDVEMCAKLLQDAMSDFISSTSYLAQCFPIYKMYPTPAFKKHFKKCNVM